ncbi:UNVERIFIED_CONTAM: restriction endonuclease subunit S [Campylobacter lari]
MKDNKVVKTKNKLSDEAALMYFNNFPSPVGTLVMSFKLTIGKVAILEMPAYHNEAIISIFPFIDESNFLRNYLYTILPLVSNAGDFKSAIKGKTLNSESINNLLIPLPPLEEQKRIVAKVEELLPLIEEYKDNEIKLVELNKK